MLDYCFNHLLLSAVFVSRHEALDRVWITLKMINRQLVLSCFIMECYPLIYFKRDPRKVSKDFPEYSGAATGGDCPPWLYPGIEKV